MASAASSKKAFIFNDLFDVTAVNPDGKKFDRVSRLVCKSHTFDVTMRIDVATDVYPMKQGQKFRMALAQTLRLDGKPDDGTYDQSGEANILDKYDFHDGHNVSIFASFGGLLMLLQGDQQYFVNV